MQQAAKEEAAHLDQLVADVREKVEATKAAKLRSAESRCMHCALGGLIHGGLRIFVRMNCAF